MYVVAAPKSGSLSSVAGWMKAGRKTKKKKDPPNASSPGDAGT